MGALPMRSHFVEWQGIKKMHKITSSRFWGRSWVTKFPVLWNQSRSRWLGPDSAWNLFFPSCEREKTSRPRRAMSARTQTRLARRHEERAQQRENFLHCLMHKTLLEGLITNWKLTGNISLVCFGFQSFSKCNYQQLRNGEGERIFCGSCSGAAAQETWVDF